MRLSLSVLVALLGLCAFSSAATAKSLDGPERAQAVADGLVGTVAPRLVFKTIDGQKIDLGSFYGKKAVYLKFWATWCVPCREQMPHLEHTYQNAGSDLAVIAVDIALNDTLEDVQALRSKLGLTMPIVFDDGRLSEAFHLRVTPQHVIIGKDGRVQYVGWLADQRLEDALSTARTAVDPKSPVRVGARAVEGPYYSVGDRLPSTSVQTLDGSTFPLRDSNAGDATVLVFIYPYCEHDYLAKQRPQISATCRQVREQVTALSKENTRVRWLGVASTLWTNRDDLTGFQYAPGIPLTLDESGTWFKSFRVSSPPTLFLVNRNGKIVRRVDGFDPTLPDLLKTAWSH